MSDSLLPRLLLLLLFLGLGALFSAAGAAIRTLNEGALRTQAEQGNKTAIKLLRCLDASARFTVTVQAGVILSGFLASAFAGAFFTYPLAAWMANVFGSGMPTLQVLALVLITLAVVFFYLIFGLLVPRRAAAHNPEHAARLTFPAVRLLAFLFGPVLCLQTACANLILRLMHIGPTTDAEEVSEDEIMAMVDIGEESGAIESAEKELIENVFEFNNITAEDVMIHRTDMVLLWVNDTQEEILNTIETSGLSRFPVYEEDADDILGILSTRQCLLNLHKTDPLPIRQLLRPAYFVPDSVRADLLFRDMQSKAVHLAIVVDEYGGTSGLVTMEDLLEELVGNIYDEFDPEEEQDIIPLGENLWRISGSAELETVADTLHISLPEEALYDTLGGLVYSQLSVIPEDGAQPEVSVCGLHIQVEKLCDRRVEWALVSVEQEGDSPAEKD